ncbi:4424_t:CDS:1, partial [Cetraspora pellucida]
MSNKKSFINNDKFRVVGTSNQVDGSSHNSQDFLNSAIEELCSVYNKEIMKGNNNDSIIYSIEQHFTNKQQNPEE